MGENCREFKDSLDYIVRQSNLLPEHTEIKLIQSPFGSAEETGEMLMSVR